MTLEHSSQTTCLISLLLSHLSLSLSLTRIDDARTSQYHTVCTINGHSTSLTLLRLRSNEEMRKESVYRIKIIMFRTCAIRKSGRFGEWPWPVKLPLKEHWFHSLPRTDSIAAEAKQVYFLGDLAVAGVLLFAAWRLVNGRRSGAHQTHLSHLTRFPPAIVANNFDFENIDKNRTVDRATLDEYRAAFAKARVEGRSVDSVIFDF